MHEQEDKGVEGRARTRAYSSGSNCGLYRCVGTHATLTITLSTTPTA